MAPFSKPETVLKQAEGLVSVGQTHAALQSLTEMFSSKRFRSTPLASLEPIMLRFIELCVDMRKGRTAKEGLMQYKNIAQNSSVGSIEVVINRFLQLADAKVQEAQEKADKAVAVEVDDLEASETPESILLGAVSGDQTKDRTDRALVTPWLKFLWESYRTALETLKNNARLEVIYQQIAQQAFRFCLKHQRKVEFRRLCETLRLHLSNVAKYAHQPHAINLSDPETLQHHLDTRFAQLNTSVELELWQEAFRSVEDVHNLLTMAKKAPRPAMMANYYEKLTKIFLMSGNALYHAAAWGRYYSIVTAIGGKSEDEMRRLAGQVLISALAVPVGSKAVEGAAEDSKGKNTRLTALLGLNKTPTRAGLLRDALSRNVLKLSPEPIKTLYTILEVTFDPLTLCTSIAPLFSTLASDASYAPYLPLLQHAVLSRLLSQLSQVYSSIKISNLLDLVAPLRDESTEGHNVFDEEQLEAYIMRCARRGELGVLINHAEGSINFVDGLFTVIEDPSSSTMASASAIQPSTSEVVSTRLSSLAECLYNSLLAINPPTPLSEEEQKAKFTALVTAANAERKALQLRRSIVARRRELLSELSARKEKEEASRRAELNRRERDEEQRRALEEVRRKEVERARKEIETIRNEEVRKLAQSLKEKGTLKVDINDMENLNTDNLMRLQVEQLEKEKKEQTERMRIAAKRLDHIERAYRKEERPLLAKDYDDQQASDKAAHEAAQKARIEASKLAHQQNLETKKRLARVMDDYKAYRATVESRRGEEFTKRQELAEKKIEEEKTKRRNLIVKEREEEAARRAEEERLRREKEEEERRREEGMSMTSVFSASSHCHPVSQSNGFISSPLNPNAAHALRSRPGSRGSTHFTRVASEESQALTSPFATLNPSQRGSMVLYRLAVDDDDLLLPPKTLQPRDSVASSSGDSIFSLSSDSKYPSGMAAARSGFVPYAYDPDLDTKEDGDDDDSFNSGEDDHPICSCSIRGFLNIGVLVILIAALLTLFVCYPVLTFYRNNARNLAIDGNIRVNATGQATELFQMPDLVDPDTPDSVKTRTGFDGEKYELVFSDEFNRPNRTFYPGDDPYWEAVDLWYGSTGDQEYYDPSQITTRDGYLAITLDLVEDETLNHDLPGYIEISLTLPGPTPDAQGYWPGAWTMGNLGRPGYGATSDGAWPYSYQECDVGTFPNQTYANGTGPLAALHSDQSRSKYNMALSWLPGQRASACTCPGEDHPGPDVSVGRGAPEIDILEVERNKTSGMGQVVSQSAQFAPFTHDYLYGNDTTDMFDVYSPDITRPNSYHGSAVQQAISCLTNLPDDMLQGTGQVFTTLGFEYWANPDDPSEGFITWMSNGQPTYRLGAAAVGPDMGINGSMVGQRRIPEEPMSIVLNLAISSSWQTVDPSTMVFPSEMLVDYVRVYQRSDSLNVGCDPPRFPTADYINRHPEAYSNPNLTYWSDTKPGLGLGAGYPWPKNSLYEGGC
ncbi:hypothetical protein NM688_g4097 [Phlebia brevispora]|uniref:Uncharacterized protein n=1 Tax=Phlebia brevispora TaxID=194682 RepID=A0ACC1T3P5_9APHY|nr:hypothetical protein NM688_g4097 [Phlebia brevispora]